MPKNTPSCANTSEKRRELGFLVRYLIQAGLDQKGNVEEWWDNCERIHRNEWSENDAPGEGLVPMEIPFSQPRSHLVPAGRVTIAAKPMVPSTSARTRSPALRRIPWHLLHDEQEASDQVWSALPEEHVTRQHVERFLREEGLVPAVAGSNILYAYADGPRELGSPVQSEWYFEFRFADQQRVQLGIEKRLLGP